MNVLMKEALEEHKKERQREKEAKAREMADQEKRGTNIIIFRVEETVEKDDEESKRTDADLVENLRNTIGAGEAETTKVTRLGKRSAGRNRSIRVTCKDTNSKECIMQNLKHLGEAEEKYASLIVMHDLTPKQRKERKELVEKAKEESTAETICVVHSEPGPRWDPKIVRLRRRQAPTH
jgi:hypothetical protein